LAKALNIADGRRAEQTFVFAVKVGCVVVADAVGGAGSVEVFCEHKATRFLQAQAFLELQRAHRRNRLKVVVETRNTHAQIARDSFNLKRLVEVLTETNNRGGNVRSVAAQVGEVAKSISLCPQQETVDNLPHDKRHEDARFGWAIEQLDETDDRYQAMWRDLPRP
jgi:hypothetical protein